MVFTDPARGARLGEAGRRLGSIGSLPPGVVAAVLPLGPPDEHGSPYLAASAFAAWPGLLAQPDAPVSGDELEDFVARHAFWIGPWTLFAGPDANRPIGWGFRILCG